MVTNHIGIKVKDVEACKKFYCENLGFEVEHKYEDEDKILMFLKNENSVLELIYSKNKEFGSVNNGIIEHIAFTVDDIQEYIDKLKKNNVKFLTDIIKVDGKLVTFFEGSQGEKLELVEHLKL